MGQYVTLLFSAILVVGLVLSQFVEAQTSFDFFVKNFHQIYNFMYTLAVFNAFVCLEPLKKYVVLYIITTSSISEPG